jgi:hypothetical protein
MTRINYIGDKSWLIPTLCTSNHPSDPWPLACHPEAMQMSFRQPVFATDARRRRTEAMRTSENSINAKFAEYPIHVLW